MIRVGAASMGWSGTPLRDVFKQLADMGGECVEINSRTEQHHHITLNQETIADVLRAAKQYHLVIGSLSGYCDFTLTDREQHQAEINKLMTTCRMANALEVPVVRAFVGDQHDGITFDSARSQVIDTFQTVAQRAEKLGVTIAIENHGRLINDGPLLAALLDDINSDHIRITLDTGNFSWAGHDLEQTWADFRAVLPYTANVHIKDGIWQGDRFEFVAAGAGSLQIAKLVNELRASGYAGSIYSEYEGKSDFTANTRLSIAFLKQATGY
jgi:sugar phosphate isomerase/epimerase